MIIKKELPHQGAFLQAPYVFPEIRFFFEICGYAAGKTSSLGDAIFYAISYFMGKKDREGKNPKIAVCGITLTFLQKTLTGAIEQVLRNTKSSYKYDKKSNIIYIGNVELLLIPIEDESTIFGYDTACIEKDTLVSTLRGDIPIKDVVVGDYALTTKGYKRVVRTMFMGIKETIEVNGIRCTPDHRFIDIFNNEIEAQDLTKNVPLVKLNTTEVLKWEKVLQEEVLKQTLWNSMVLDIIGTQKVKVMEKEAILPVLMSIKEKVTQRITETCGESITAKYQKGMIYTILTETILIILLKTLRYLREENTLKNIIMRGLRKGSKSSLKVLKRHTPEIKSCLTNQNIEKEYQNLEKKLQKGNGTIKFVLCVVKSLLHMMEKLSTARIRVLKLRVTKETEKCLEKLKKQERATYVEKSSGQVSIPLLQRVQPVVKMSKEDRRLEEVYDIEVEEAHEFFAGGILVHNCAFVDELDELPTHTCIAVVKALNDRCRQSIVGETRSPFLAFTTTSQGLKGTYQTIMNFRKIGMSYMIIRGRTRDNIYLQKEYVEAMYKMYNEKETKCLLEGEFISIDSGLVFPDYNPAYNKLDIDLYNSLDAGETVYIGQDFNCIEGNEGILTDTGIIPIRDIVLGTRVLTRKGYKKVLTKKNNGSRIVVRCGNVWTTLDHVFITPKGDEERWKLSNYYYLKKQHRSKFHDVKKLKVKEQQLLSYIKDIYGDHIKEHGILSSRAKAETSGCTERYMKTLLVKYLVEWLFTIKTECLIIFLKTLSLLREKNTLKSMKQGKEYRNTGKKVSSKKKGLCAEYAVKHLQEISKRLKYAEKNVFSLVDEREGMQPEQYLEQRVESVFGKRGGRTVQLALNPLRKLADAVALSLKENLNLFTALRVLKNVKELANGRVLYGVEREVFDIEVEDAHEFFVDGVLVHNCGFNKAVACIVKNRCIYVIKTYSFGDAREAPEVYRYDFPEQKIIWIPDMTYKEHFGDFAKELKMYNIRIAYRRCNPNIVSRNFAINKLLYARRLFLCDFASALDNALLIHQKDPKTGLPMKGQGENAPDHLTDALAYGVAHLIGWKRELKDVYDVTMGRALKKHKEIGSTEEDDEDALNAIDNLAEMTV